LFGLKNEPEESYKVLIDKLKQLDPNSEEALQIKQKINKMREDSGLLTYAQLKPLKELKELKPLKLPGEKDPTQAISTCPYCNSCVNQKEQQCPNCKQIITPNQGQPHPRKVPQKGERYDDYGPKLDYISKGVPLAASSSKIAKKHKDPDLAKHDKEIVRDKHISKEFNMCSDPKRKKTDFVDKKEEIMRSCQDLAIDG